MTSAGKVLVADDDATNRLLLTRLLERDEFEVTGAEDGVAAMDLLTSRPFDVVLLDIVMPRMDGVAVLQHVKADERLRDIPVVMVSATDEMATVVRCIELGADDFLPKPADRAVLRARINAGLARKRLADLQREYLEQVAHVVDAAEDLESGAFSAQRLDEVAARDDALGLLARVFQRVATEVAQREQTLRAEVSKLRIEIDQTRAARQVDEITGTDFFHDLERRATRMRLNTPGDA